MDPHPYRSRKLLALLGVLCCLAGAPAAFAATFGESRDAVFDQIARQDDRGALSSLVAIWRDDPQPERWSNALMALNQGLEGSPARGRVMLTRDLAAHPEEPTLRLASALLVLLERNPKTSRQALTNLVLVFPESRSLYQRLADDYANVGEIPPAMWRIPQGLPPEAQLSPLPVRVAAGPDVKSRPTARPTARPVASPRPTPRSTPTPRPTPHAPASPPPLTTLRSAPSPVPLATASESYEVRPVTGRSQREQLLRQLEAAQGHGATATPKPLWASVPQPVPSAAIAARPTPTASKATPGPSTPLRPSARPTRAKLDPAWLAAERKRIQDATRLSTEEAARRRARAQAEQAFLNAERKRRQDAELKVKHRSDLAYQAQILEQRRVQAQTQMARQRSELDRWQAAREAVPPPPAPVLIAPPDHPGAARGLMPSTLKVAKLPTNRRVWIGEPRASVRARLGPPVAVEGNQTVDYAGLQIQFDPVKNLVCSYRNQTGYYWGPGGIRAGMGLREVISCTPGFDGLFHLMPDAPGATSSLYAISTVDGLLIELQQTQGIWLSTWVEATSPGATVQHYEDICQHGAMRRVLPEVALNLEARHLPLP